MKKRKKVILAVSLICVFALLISVLPVKKWMGTTVKDQVAYQENVAGTGFLGSLKKWISGDSKEVENTAPTPTPHASGSSLASIPAGSSLENMTVDGENRTYTTYVPESVPTANTPVDILIVLHGTGGTGEGIRETGFDTYADTKGFVTIYPDSLIRDGVAMWDPTNRQVKDIDFIQAIIAEKKTLFGDQTGNIYIAGMSNGSVMTQAMGCVTSEIDGIAAVAAGMGSEFFPYCTADRLLPFIGFYGTEDRFDQMAKYESSVAFFAKENGCTDSFTATTMPDIDPNDGTTVEKRVYKATNGKACKTPVHYYRITGGGHFWPGGDNYQEDRLERNTGSVTQDIDATQLIVEFFGL